MVWEITLKKKCIVSVHANSFVVNILNICWTFIMLYYINEIGELYSKLNIQNFEDNNIHIYFFP